MAAETIYIIRHATPDWERRDIPYHLPPGPPLTAAGRAEAEALGAFLLAGGVRLLHSSPLERALHTARIASAPAGAAVRVDERLIEWQPGDSETQVMERMLAALAGLRAADGGNGNAAAPALGLVTHGGPIAMLLQGLGMDVSTIQMHRRFDRSNPAPPAGVWEAYRADLNSPWRLRLAFIPGGIELNN